MSIINAGLEGLQRAEVKLERTANRISQFPLSAGAAAADTIDLSVEAVSLLQARNAYEANLKLLETGFNLEESSIDLLG